MIQGNVIYNKYYIKIYSIKLFTQSGQSFGCIHLVVFNGLNILKRKI